MKLSPRIIARDLALADADFDAAKRFQGECYKRFGKAHRFPTVYNRLMKALANFHDAQAVSQ